MHKDDRIFVDGLATVRMTNGVILFDFYNTRANGVKESCGEIVMSQQAFLQAYGAMDDLVKKMIDAGIIVRGGEGQKEKAAVTESASPNFE